VIFGNPETTTGGNALKFYSSVRLDVRKIGSIKEKDDVIGNQTKVKIVKNKVAPPFKIVEFDIIYNQGLSKSGEVVDLGVKMEIIGKSGSWFSYAEQRMGQGRENVKKHLEQNPKLMEEIISKIQVYGEEIDDFNSSVDETEGENEEAITEV
jgi:recombination protein RecA